MGARRRAGFLVVLALGLLAGAPAAGADVSSAEIVRLLSAQREANGIPGALVERADWSYACDKHNHYEAQTGEFGHEEDPSSPYYSVDGDWAGRHSVIAYGRGWDTGNPWEDAPIHLLQMLAPTLSEMGAAESYGHNCATTWPGYKRPEPAALTAYSYPGDGVSGVVPTEYASESPAIPGDFVGLPEGTATGRYLLTYLRGLPSSAEAGAVTASATLANAEGPAELRVIDSTSSDIGFFMPRPSAFLIPVRPLKPLTGYNAEVRWALDGAPLFTQRFAFTTGTDPVSGAETIKKKRSDGKCRAYARSARKLRLRAGKTRLHGLSLVHRKTSSSRQRHQGHRLLARSQKLRRQARKRAKQASLCRAHPRLS
ncbi:MAG TPA: hypothetical protein VFS48_02455 [Solirubrobacterales bacterium]|nr:hypothetical protein [Solirubrobacterales bacterium]